MDPDALLRTDERVHLSQVVLPMQQAKGLTGVQFNGFVL
jgi:hypothetical protein